MKSCYTPQDGRGQAGQKINKADGDVGKGRRRMARMQEVGMVPPFECFAMDEMWAGGGPLTTMFAFGEVAGCRDNPPSQFAFNRDLRTRYCDR